MINKERFERGFLDYKDYIKSLSSLRPLAEEIYDRIKLDEKLKEVIEDKIKKFGFINILCVAEPYCEDSACNIPVVNKLFENNRASLRIFIRSLNPDIEEKLYERGIKKIPTFIFYDGEFKEISVWIERPKRADELIKKWKEEHPEFERLKKSNKKEDIVKIKELHKEFLNFIKEKYIEFLWKETVKEIIESL